MSSAASKEISRSGGIASPQDGGSRASRHRGGEADALPGPPLFPDVISAPSPREDRHPTPLPWQQSGLRVSICWVPRSFRRTRGSSMSRADDTGARIATPETGKNFYISPQDAPHRRGSPSPFLHQRVLGSLQPRRPRAQLPPIGLSLWKLPPPRAHLLKATPPYSLSLLSSQGHLLRASFPSPKL